MFNPCRADDIAKGPGHGKHGQPAAVVASHRARGAQNKQPGCEKGAKAGDKITIGWVDNKGDKRSDEATVS